MDVRDLADVAALALLDPTHRGQGYTLTGPEPVSFAAAVAMLSQEVGRGIHHEPASIVGYMRHLRRRGLPASQIVVQTILHAGLRFGQAERVDPMLATLLGRRPRTLAEYFHDARSLFQPARRVGNHAH